MLKLLQQKKIEKKPGRSYGFTLLELLVCLAVIVMLTSIAIPYLQRVMVRSKNAVDGANLNILNRATYSYAISEKKDIRAIFENISTDEMRMNELVDKKYIAEPITSQITDVSFCWSTDFQVWYSDFYSINTSTAESFIYNFSTAELESFVTTDRWYIADSGFQSAYGRMFIENPNDEYTISLNATLDPDRSDTDGGYGIFFESKYSEDDYLDTGYILQFDRGLAGILIEYRDDRKTYEGGESDENRVVYTSSDSDIIPDNKDSEWWTTAHEITLDVNNMNEDENLKVLSVWIDGVLLLDDYEFQSTVSAAENHTGLRSWHEETIYNNLTIDGK